MVSLPPSSNAAAIKEAEQLLAALKAHHGSPAEQQALVRRLDRLRTLVHTPFDALLFQAIPFQMLPALNIMSEFGVFDALDVNGRMTATELAAASNLDPTILSRFLRILLTQGIFNEAAPGVYEHTPASAMFRSDQAASFYNLGLMQFPQWWKVADYLKSHSAKDAQDATKVPFSWASGKEGKSYYQVIEEDPTWSDVWHKGMTMIEMTQPITGMFPFESMKDAVQAESERAFVVDVGGGRGNALVTMMKECGGSYGSTMVLQDMAEVLEGNDPVRIQGVENMPHNFYNPQPVKNAHIYYLRNVLHNHYDDRSRIILQHIVHAMGPSSRLLIGEMVLSATASPGSDPFPFFMDLNMFMEGGLERTEDDFAALFDSVGLRIEKIWRHPSNPVQATIEVRLK